MKVPHPSGRDVIDKGSSLAGHIAAIAIGFVLMFVGLAMGVTMVMLPIGLVIGIIGVLLFVWGLLSRRES